MGATLPKTGPGPPRASAGSSGFGARSELLSCLWAAADPAGVVPRPAQGQP